MKLKRIAFQAVVPSPGSDNFSFSYWLQDYAAPAYEIVQAGDMVIVTHVESSRSYVYPWTHVAGAEPEFAPDQHATFALDAGSGGKRGKR